jgi:putative ABC transport system substrate-binding protein
MRRREFIALVGGAAAWPITGPAEEAANVARIGYLSTNLASSPHHHEAFRQRLRDLGYVEGRKRSTRLFWEKIS